MKLITGMQRSGTSLITRIFMEAGADLGDTETFYRPDKWNADGYFEQPEIHEVNMPLINGPWGKLAYLHLPSTQTILKRAPALEHRIRAAAETYRGKVVKETRFCLTLPAWLRYETEVDRMLVCLRDPIQTARSLNKRYRLPLSWGLKIWKLHNARLLEHAEEIPMWFVYYRNILNPERCQKELAPALNFMGVEVSDDRLKEITDECVKPSMNHHPDQEKLYTSEIQSLWHNLLDRHNNQKPVTLVSS